MATAKRLPSNPSLKHLKLQAKQLHKAHQSGEPDACIRIQSIHPDFANASAPEIPNARLGLTDAQFIIAREYGFESWPQMKHYVEGGPAQISKTVRAFAANLQPHLQTLQTIHTDYAERLGKLFSGFLGKTARLSENRTQMGVVVTNVLTNFEKIWTIPPYIHVYDAELEHDPEKVDFADPDAPVMHVDFTIQSDDFTSTVSRVGFCASLDDQIVSTASSQIHGQKIEVTLFNRHDFTDPDVESAVCAALIIHCLKAGIEPCWRTSRDPQARLPKLAERLGYIQRETYEVLSPKNE